MPEPVTIDKFGKDHWGTFAYIETVCVDHGGKPDARRLRADGVKYPTILKGGETSPGHSDWDCADDLESEGLLVNEGTAVNPRFRLTDQGWRVAAELRRHKAGGGMFAGFEPSCRPYFPDEEKRALHWIIGGDTGISSIAIWAVMTGQVEMGAHGVSGFLIHDVPKDAGDFGRCYRLLEFIPEWKERLHEVGNAIPRWQPFVREWKALESLFLKSQDMSTMMDRLWREGRSVETGLRDTLPAPGAGG